MRELLVKTSTRSYPVWIARGCLAQAGSLLKSLFARGTRVAVLHDAKLGQTSGRLLSQNLRASTFEVECFPVPSGERAKSIAEYERLCRTLALKGFPRDGLLVALGGGTVGDLAGFVAATFLRGVPYVHVPTTLTAQADSAIGGKTALNLPEGKNLIGAYYQPWAVLIDPGFADGLPERQYRAGLAEIVKTAVAVDGELFGEIERSLEPLRERRAGRLESLLARTVEAKASVVEKDERDRAGRLVLNYGHTLGHAMEASSNGRLLHGEAVSIGMTFAATLSRRIGICSDGLVERQTRVLERIGLPRQVPRPAIRQLFPFLRRDKKIRDGRLRWVLPVRFGKVIVSDTVPERIVKELLGRIESLTH